MLMEKFNKKYKDYCEEGFEKTGPLEFDIPEATKLLDLLFWKVFVYVPGFKVSQIKLKFGKARFYSTLPPEMNHAMEREIDRIIELKAKRQK